MAKPFEILGPFECDKAKVGDPEYPNKFWSERDKEYPQLSEANGLYMFSLRYGENYDPTYVGMTRREFGKEVFNPNNQVKILYSVREKGKKGKLCLHLLAKPKDSNDGFYRVHKKSLHWTEMFLLMLCRKKNPEILNIAGHVFLEDCGIEGVTYPSNGVGKAVKTFRNAVALDKFTGGRLTKSAAKPLAKPSLQSSAQPTAQSVQSPAYLTAHVAAQPANLATAEPMK